MIGHEAPLTAQEKINDRADQSPDCGSHDVPDATDLN
jgi:hypothetical protein